MVPSEIGITAQRYDDSSDAVSAINFRYEKHQTKAGYPGVSSPKVASREQLDFLSRELNRNSNINNQSGGSPPEETALNKRTYVLSPGKIRGSGFDAENHEVLERHSA